MESKINFEPIKCPINGSILCGLPLWFCRKSCPTCMLTITWLIHSANPLQHLTQFSKSKMDTLSMKSLSGTVWFKGLDNELLLTILGSVGGLIFYFICLILQQTDRQTDRQTETDRNRQKQTETDRIFKIFPQINPLQSLSNIQN